MLWNLDQGANGWHKSSYSADDSDCIEIGTFSTAHPETPAIAVRDTKHHRTGPLLAFTAASWAAFLAEVKATP
ncbi:DUF397 domain-containing protein [Streptomyces sp. NPDC048483]|uniref:DUF397 domain-containing protein n=1 Tax=Streptomyces sp. NPDC048483 TaxID=3154927 RepID=UPI00344808BC